MNPEPFSDNIVFLDAEFTSLDPYTGELLSVALVRPTGEECYVEIGYDPTLVDPWVSQHILPLLEGNPVSPETARATIRTFLGDTLPYPVSYVTPFDTVFLHKLFGASEWPMSRYPIDFAAMLFMAGLSPANLLENDRSLSKALGVESSDSHRMHHALNDARLLRDAYGKLLRYVQK